MESVLASGEGTELRERDDGPAVTADELVDLLGDEMTRQVLKTIADEAKGGREIAESLPVSRPTVYRRLNELVEAGLVDTTMVVCPDGHHHKQYRAVLETARFRLGEGGLTADVRTEAESPTGVVS